MRRGRCRKRPPRQRLRLEPEAKGGGLFADLQAEFHAEVARLSALAAAQLGDPGGDGLRTVELAIRTAMLKLGGSLLEDLLAVDTGHRGPRVACDQGHGAEFVSYRSKPLDTVLGEVTLRRAWYHCTSVHEVEGDGGGQVVHLAAKPTTANQAQLAAKLVKGKRSNPESLRRQMWSSTWA